MQRVRAVTAKGIRGVFVVGATSFVVGAAAIVLVGRATNVFGLATLGRFQIVGVVDSTGALGLGQRGTRTLLVLKQP